MKIQAVYDRDGRILAAMSRPGNGDLGPSAHIAPSEGSDIDEFDVPVNFEGKHLHEFIQLLCVDTMNRRLVPIKR